MTAAERRASVSLASVFALRMLGLFLVLPVFALEAARLPGGDDPALVGLAMGMYGLTQALMQAPLGLLSDRLGRKRVIVLGLLVFALGSVGAALAPSVQWLAVARGVQGAGAVSAAVTALLADLTRDAVRTKAMALVGMSIGAMFALSLVVAPPLAAAVGLGGLFGLTALLALAAVAAVLWHTPPEPPRQPGAARVPLAQVLGHPLLWRLNLGVFVLHTVQMALWGVVPGLLVAAGLAKAAHWQVYLPAVGLSFVLLGGLFALERRGKLAGALRGAVALLLLVQLALLWLAPRAPGVWALGAVLFFFFVAFNVLEASQPSLVSRLAPPASRGAALGVYNTLQSLGLFAGGVLGGWLLKAGGAAAVLAATSALVLLWLALGWGQPVPARQPQR
ncbi:MAG: MFS transporter [Pseudomonadota bacterium]|nr:MFS transporter [Pseudomonadota bacterium]